MTTPFESGMVLGFSAVILALVFFGTWYLSVKLDNYSFVDVTWALSFTPIVIWYALSGGGWSTRRLIIATLISLWSLRLGVHLLTRVAQHHPEEDPRYAELRKKWQAHLTRSFLLFFLAQGVLVWLLTLPVFLICQQPDRAFHSLEYLGLSIWLLALVGEGIADLQMKRFKAAHRHDRDAICRDGLWRYSRHPNYFFQSLLWWGLFLVALAAPWGWITICAPLAMLHFLLNVTGIPLTEKLSLKRRGESYRNYQRTTNAFVPWFPKS